MNKDELENKIPELLELVAGKGIRELYEDARILISNDDLHAPEKAIGHYLREIESALLSVTVTIAKLNTVNTVISQYEDGTKSDSSRAERIDLITNYFKLNLDVSQLEFWKKTRFDRLAHRNGLMANKKITDAYIEQTWIPFSKIILEIAEGIHKVFLDYFGQLKQIAKNPSSDNCKIVLQEIPNNRHLRDYFFKEIENFSAWLPMLKSGHVFEDVPRKYASDEGYVITQPWPPLVFLIRIVEENHNCKTLLQVAVIASQIPETKNARVNVDLLDLAGKLPAQLSTKYLMPRIMSALNSEGLYLMGEMVSGLLIKFNEAGFNENLLEISEKVIFDEKFNLYFKDTYIGNNTDFYFYDSLLTVLSGFNHKGILRLLHHRALEGLSLSYEDNQHEKYNTMYWIHAFDEEVENESLALVYVSNLFIAIKNLLSSNNATLEEIVKMLSEGNHDKSWHIIDALILNILETYDEHQTYDSYRSELHKKLSDYEENRSNRGEPQVKRASYVSPYLEEELSSLTALDVLDRLAKYEGPIVDPFFNELPSKIGLRQSVERQIKQRPKEFVECLESFMKLENDDCANLICAFTQADIVSDTNFEKAYLALVNEFIVNRYEFSSEQNRRNFSQSVCRIFRKIYNSPDCFLELNGFAFKALDKFICDKSISSALLSSTKINRFQELALHAQNTPSIDAFGCFLHCYITP